MGMGGISIWQLLIILVIVLLLFGTKKLKNLGSDLGGAVRGFRSAMNDGERTQNDDESADEKANAQLSAKADETGAEGRVATDKANTTQSPATQSKD